MISLFRKHNIHPLFVFDGKPPEEKREEISKRKSSCYFLSSWRSLISLSHLNFQDCEGESLSLLLTHDTLFFAPLSLPVRKALYFWRDTYIFRVRSVVENSHLVKLQRNLEMPRPLLQNGGLSASRSYLESGSSTLTFTFTFSLLSLSQIGIRVNLLPLSLSLSLHFHP